MSAVSSCVDVVREQLARHRLRRCTWVGGSPRVRGRLWIHGPGDILVGDRVLFDASRAPIELYAWRGATIVVGDDTYVGGGCSLEATASIRIGARNRLEAFCRIMDNHFHPLVGDRNETPTPRPVALGDDVSLGPRTIVLAGASLPAGTWLPAGSVVNAPRRGPP